MFQWSQRNVQRDNLLCVVGSSSSYKSYARLSNCNQYTPTAHRILNYTVVPTTYFDVVYKWFPRFPMHLASWCSPRLVLMSRWTFCERLKLSLVIDVTPTTRKTCWNPDRAPDECHHAFLSRFAETLSICLPTRILILFNVRAVYSIALRSSL
jgi:hypothetical protein